MEVVLALVLFVAAASVITRGLNVSVNEVARLRLNLHANNLAASVLAEMQMGLKPIESSGPNAFAPPFESWSWEAKAAPVNDTEAAGSQLQNVEIVVRRQSPPVVWRLVQYLPVTPGAETVAEPPPASPERGNKEGPSAS